MSKTLTEQLQSLSDNSKATRNEYARAPFGYPGAKTRSVKQILGILPYRQAFIDVCGGAGTILLARNTSKLEVFNDRNSGIVCLYRCIRDLTKMKALIARLEIAPPASREEFLWSRDTWDCDQLDDVERAARYYYTVHHSFATKGWQFGRAVTGINQANKAYNGLETFGRIHNRLRNVTLENLDWKQILKDYKGEEEGVVWYIDPPYWRTFGVYDHEWKEDEHVKLCEAIQDLSGYVAVSGYDHPDHPYNKFKWTQKYTWEVSVSMTAQAFTEENNLLGCDMTRGKAEECLWVRE